MGAKLNEEDLKKIEPELQEMLGLAKDRGLWGKIELGVSKGTETTGAVLEELGKKMRARRTPGLSDIAARTYLTVFRGTYDLLVGIARASLVTLDTIAKKVNVSVFGRHAQLSSSKRDVLVGRMVRKLNPAAEPGVPLGKKAKEDARRIVFSGRAMTHAARLSKSQDQQRARGIST